MKTPSDWKRMLLHNVAEVRSGLSKSSKREGPTIRKPYLRVANVQDGFLDLSEIKEIDVPASQVARFTLKPGDLLLIEGNGNPENLGRGCIWGGQIADCVHQNHVFTVRTLPEAEVLSTFLALQLQSDHGRNYFLSCAKGSTGLSTLNSAQLKEFPVLAPSIAEQQSIIGAIAAWNTATQKVEQLMAAKEQHYTHELSRLISRGHHPRGHVGSFAHEVSERNRGGGNEARVLSVTNSRGFVLPEDHFERRVASADLSNYKVVRRGQYAYNPSRINVGSIARLDGWDDGVLSPMYAVFGVDESKINSDYFLHWLDSHEARERIKKSAQGSVRETVSFTEFAGLAIPLPGVTKQAAIARYLNALREEITTFGNYLEALKTQKRGLMQKLLTGQWRVKVPETEAA
jgi:type I restriction enzyme S subunit